MINTYLATGLLSAAVAFGSAWQIQDWRSDAREKDRNDSVAAADREGYLLDQKRITAVISAQNAARDREVALRSAAAAAVSELGGLRAQSGAAIHAAEGSHAACLERATAFSAVLDQCSAAYQELGAAADRHVSDIETLTDAWPKD